MKLGLIGCGYWGKNLIRDFYSLGALHYICDINLDFLTTFKEKYPKLNVTTDFQVLLDNVDAVCVSLPAEMHYKFAKMALEQDKDVYVEKPITLDISQAEDLIRIAKERNRILMVGHLLHYHPCIEKIKEIVSSGKLGSIKNIVCNRLNLGIFRQQENVLWSFAPHDISVILALCNDKLPNNVSCHGFCHINDNIHDITNSVLSYDDKYVNINVNWLNPYKEQKMSIIGTKGMICFDDTSKTNKLTYYPEYITYTDDLNARPIPVKNNGEVLDVDLSVSPLVKECQHFIDCCNNRSKPISDGEEGLRVLKVLNALQESLIKKKPVDFTQSNIMVHETAYVDQGASIGEGTKIWHYSHVSSGAVIGKNCNIGQNVFIAPGAVIGNNCKVQNNVSIYKGVKAGNNVFFGPSCVLTNDINPRCEYSKNGQYKETIIEDGVTLGANCTIVCGRRIGKYAMIGAGAVVCKDVEPNTVHVGNPSKPIARIDEKGNRFYE